MNHLLALAGGASIAAAAFVPTGATIEPSGFATIERATIAPLSSEPPPSDNRPQGEADWYARDNGISVEEATKRQREQQALMPQFERLLGILRTKEAGNFTAARLTHQPDWAYELYFKRDPERTLAKYTVNPRFRPALARYTRAELEALSKPWTDRFTKHRLAGGWGVDDTYGTAEIMMNVTEEEYRAIATREGWGDVAAPVRLMFSAPLPHPSVEDSVRPFLRAFGHESRSTVIQLEAGFTGKIAMRDGCLRIGTGKDAPLAFFHRETGIGVDEDGYLALKDRRTGKSKGRIGGWFSWAGPNGVAEDDPALAELHAQCGPGPVMNAGNPESLAQFRARPHLIDEVARERRIGRKAAWERLKRCWARQEAQHPERVPDERC